MIKAIFLMQADDSKGLLASAVDFFYGKGFNILHCQQHTDSYGCHGIFYLICLVCSQIVRYLFCIHN